ncbi:MAG: TlpA family protein disulfide reductase [Proteobacteria bacterium]|nr:TlpA family protein disulfide reductase [Pseudomonadota bacterium]
MLKRAALLIILIGLAVPTVAVETGAIAPAWIGVDYSGGEVDFPSVIDGKPTVVVFWATWCSYCKAFMPYLKGIQRDYGEQKINILVINAKERGAGDPAAYVDKLGFPLIAVADGDEIADAYGIRFIPGLLIVDGQGDLAWQRASTDLPAGKTVAELWDQQVREQLDRLL